MERVEDVTPYTGVFLQELERMNDLIFEVRRSLIELDSGLNGDMSITEPMELIMYTLAYGKVPNSQLPQQLLFTPVAVYVFCVLVETAHVSKPRQPSIHISKQETPSLRACLCIHNEHKRACKVRKASLALATTRDAPALTPSSAERATERATVRAAEHANAGRERDERASQRAAGRAACRDVADLSVEGSVRPGLCSGRGWHDGQGDAGAAGAARAGG
jgi:hypothetical protein